MFTEGFVDQNYMIDDQNKTIHYMGKHEKRQKCRLHKYDIKKFLKNSRNGKKMLTENCNILYI